MIGRFWRCSSDAACDGLNWLDSKWKISRHGLYHHPTCCVGRSGDDAMARNHGRQGAALRPSILIQLRSAAKNGGSKRGTRESAIYHQFNCIDV